MLVRQKCVVILAIMHLSGAAVPLTPFWYVMF